MKRHKNAASGRCAPALLPAIAARTGWGDSFQVGLGENIDIDRPDGNLSGPDAGGKSTEQRRLHYVDNTASVVVVNQATLESFRPDSAPTEIDNDFDKPTASIVSPQNIQNLGGSVLVTGTAYDDELDRVEMRIGFNGGGAGR
ncbi:MAG: hypothetical protein ACOCY8_07190 [Spirochaetota bacterium]